jgi:hypothetical protein
MERHEEVEMGGSVVVIPPFTLNIRVLEEGLAKRAPLVSVELARDLMSAVIVIPEDSRAQDVVDAVKVLKYPVLKAEVIEEHPRRARRARPGPPRRPTTNRPAKPV